MGHENCGRKPISENSAGVKLKLAEIAFQGVKYLGECARGKVRPAPSRVNIILAAIDHTIGRAQTRVVVAGDVDAPLVVRLRSLTDADLEALMGMLVVQQVAIEGTSRLLEDASPTAQDPPLEPQPDVELRRRQRHQTWPEAERIIAGKAT